MKTINFRYVAVLATAISLTACSFSSLDVEKKAHDYGYNVADEDGYIKSFNVGTAAKVDPETKTLFHTNPAEYGLTTWEPGQDQLSFILRDATGKYAYMNEPEHWQRFGCESSFKKDSYEGTGDIKWAKYTVLNGNTGLQVGQNYYAYYMHGKEDVVVKGTLPMTEFYQNGQSDESLQQYMRENDILVLEQNQHDGCSIENGGLIIESPMRDVYMEHYYSLIEVDVHWVQDPLVKSGKPGLEVEERQPYDKQFRNVRFGSGAFVGDASNTPEEQKVFGGSVYLNNFGDLAILDKTSFVDCIRSDNNPADIMLSQTNDMLKFYFLLHPIDASDHYWIAVAVTENKVSNQRTIHYKLPKAMMFKPGYYYKFDLNADFSNMRSQTRKEWQDNGKLSDRDVEKYQAKGITVYDENN